MKFNVTLKLENEEDSGEIANFQIEGDYHKKMLRMFEEREPVEVRLNDTIMGKYIITAFTSKIEE